MVKKGSRQIFIKFRNARVDIRLILLASFVMFLLGAAYAYATITINPRTPLDLTVNGSRKINFTFVPVWNASDSIPGNCSIWTNLTGTWSNTTPAFSNYSNNSGMASNIANNTLSWINYTFDLDGRFVWSVRCTNLTATGGSNFSANITLTIDNSTPVLFGDRPNSTVAGPTGPGVGYGNFSSYGDMEFRISVSDNTTSRVWYYLSSGLGGAGTTQALNITMNEVRSASGRINYSANLTLNFSSPYGSPGPHSVTFCANDSIGRRNCTEPYDFFVMGMNVSQMEDQMAGTSQPGSGTFGGLNITYGNGTEIDTGTFINPVAGGNFTFIFNFSKNAIIHIVGGRVDEKQFGNASQARVNSTPTKEITNAVGSGYKVELAWADIGSFIPSEVSYEYGMIQLGGVGYSKKLYCNGTSMGNPLCHTINECNATAFGMFNHTLVIPTNDGCWLDGTATNVLINNLSQKVGYTYIFVDKFSGGYGGSDFSAPNVTITSPPMVGVAGITAQNRSTTVLQVINFTLSDINSTGMNLSQNNSINVTIYLGGTTLGFFNYTNVSEETRLSCITPDPPISMQNASTVHCNLTFNFNSNGTYIVNITGRDTSNNSNAVNRTMSNFTLLIDNVPPRLGYFNITNSSRFNASGGSTQNDTQTFDNSQGGSIRQGTRIVAVSNWTDNLTAPLTVQLQFYNITSGLWMTANSTNNTFSGGSGVIVTPSQTNTPGWANFSFTPPADHDIFEGKNVTFRVLGNDSAGAGNFTSEVMNITVQINDTTGPRLLISSVGGVYDFNGTNTTDNTPTIVWNATDSNPLANLSVQVDELVDQSCNQFKVFSSQATATANANGSMTLSETGGCAALSNGTHKIRFNATDSWGNTQSFLFNFSVETSTPVITLNTSPYHPYGKALNQSNITPYTGLNFTAIGGGAGQMKNLSWTSSCNSTVIPFTGIGVAASFNQMNGSLIYPFNYTACRGSAANRTVTVTASDFVGNSVTQLYQFFVDDVGPEVVIHNPKPSEIFNGQVNLNGSFMDRGNKLDVIVGYYLGTADGIFGDTIYNISSAPNASGLVNAFAEPGVNITYNATINLTAGTKVIKFTINDSVGNRGNSSPVTFVVSVDYEFNNASQSMEDYFNLIYQENLTNVTIRVKTDSGRFSKVGGNGSNTTNNFYELTFDINATYNISISDFNGTKANWDRINFTPIINESRGIKGLEGNWSATILRSVFFNESINNFISDYNAYYGRVELPVNISSNGTGTARELWWVPNATNLTTKINVTQCASGSAAYSRTNTVPCWNYTFSGRTIIFVPHYSHVVGVNDTTPPTVTINKPTANPSQDIIVFFPNITVSADAKNCSYVYNLSGSVLTERINMAFENLNDGTHLCTGPIIRNLTNGSTYNISYYVYDTSENLNQANRTFTVNDTTPPAPTSISASGLSATGVTITATASNESINMTVNYGTTTALGTFSRVAGFSPTNSTTLSSLTASTLYYYNVTTCDRAENCLVNGTFNFTTSAAAAAAAASTTTSSSSGGGGGAAPIANNVVSSTAKVWSSITPDTPTKMTISRPEIALTEISIQVGTEVKNVELKVEKLKSNPKKAEAAAKVFQYLEITKSNLANADIKEAKISFKVPTAWLSQNGISEDGVALYRYTEGWVQLKTAKTGSDGTNAMYEAETPGFSTFAVGSREGAPEEIAPTPTGETPTGEAVAPPAAEEKEKITVPEVPQPTAGRGAKVAVAVAVLVLIALLVGYWYKKKASK